MQTELIGIVAFCVFWTVANTFLMARVTRLMSEVADVVGKQTFAGIVEYEKQMAALPDEPAPAQKQDDRIWNLMRQTQEEILRVRGQEPFPFPWTVDQCEAYWRGQEIAFARQHPELPKDAYFDSLVDKLVVTNMWTKAPRNEPAEEEETTCALCPRRPFARLENGTPMCRHHYYEQIQAIENDSAATAAKQESTAAKGECNATDGADFCDLPVGHGGPHSWAAPPLVSYDQDDAFRNMIHGRNES